MAKFALYDEQRIKICVFVLEETFRFGELILCPEGIELIIYTIYNVSDQSKYQRLEPGILPCCKHGSVQMCLTMLNHLKIKTF